MTNSPLKLSYSPTGGFLLTAKVAFNRRSIERTLEDETYQIHIIRGIEENWTGSFTTSPEIRAASNEYFEKYFPKLELSEQHQLEIPFETKIIVDQLSNKYSPRFLFLKRLLERKRRPIPVYLRKAIIMPSHVASGILRRIWGIFRTGQIESIGYNWSRRFPGYAVINCSDNSRYLSQISAHEAGHLFGIGDAYSAWYRFYYSAPNTQDYMMYHNKQVQATEIAMLIRAYTRKKSQFFPRKFIWKNIRFGMKKELKYYAKKINNIIRKKS